MSADTMELRCADVTLLTFKMGEDPFGTPYAHITDVSHGHDRLMPWGLSLDDESLYTWLSCRALPQNRRFARELCRALSLSQNDVAGIYHVSMGLSLNDSYWTPPAGSTLSFSDVNLYENGFSEVLAAIAYTGHPMRLGPSGTPHGLTPELTTDGTLRKAWVIRDGRRYLNKGASNGWNPGEPASEVLASAIAREAGLDSTTYTLTTHEGQPCSSCECFCNRATSYVPFAVATGITDLAGTLAFAAQDGTETLEAVCDMLVLDCLTLNEDRHFTNFGLLRDTATGRMSGLAPIFDNGRSLLPMLPNDMLGEYRFQAMTMSPSFGGRSFDELASRVIGTRQLEWLSGLDLEAAREIALAETSNELREMMRSRIDGLVPMLRERVEALLGMDPVERAPLVERLISVMGQRPARDVATFRARPRGEGNPSLSSTKAAAHHEQVIRGNANTFEHGLER